MAEPPASWDQQDDDNSTLPSLASKLGGLNVNAMEFVPSFGFKPTPAPQPTVPKTPPSTPVVSQHTTTTTTTTTEDKNKQAEPVIKTDELSIQQQAKPPVSTVGETYLDDISKDEIESKLFPGIYIHIGLQLCMSRSS